MKHVSEEKNFSWADMARAIWYLLGDQKKPYIFFTIILFLVQFYDLVPVFVLGKMTDILSQISRGSSLSTFYWYVGSLTVSSATVAVIRLSVKRSLGNIQSRTSYFTRVKGFDRLLNFSLIWHDNNSTGNKVQKIQNGAATLRDLQHTLSDDIYYQFTVMLGALIAFIYMSPNLFALCIIYLVIFIFIQVKFYQILVKLNDEYNLLQESASGTYYEGLSNVLTIKTLGAKEGFAQTVMDKEALSRDHAIKMCKYGNGKWQVFQVVNAIFLGLAILIMGHSYLAGAITLGSIFVLFTYFIKVQTNIAGSTEVFDNMIAYKSAIARMMPIYWDYEANSTGSKPFPVTWKELSIQSGNFHYKQKEVDDGALIDLNLKIKRNTKVGIVGRSGSGKSTLAKLLLGLYALDSGKLTIGDSNYYDISHDEITNKIALVLQDSEMFNLSLKDNITLMRQHDVKLFQKAIEIAQLSELIESLPNGLDTIIGEKGYRLSGGERQRIGIARAIYKDPEIMVLDESTSSLDTKTENLIQLGIEKNLGDKTLILIAHRITTLKNVDKIIVFEKGQIVEEGSYSQLLDDPNSKFSLLTKKP